MFFFPLRAIRRSLASTVRNLYQSDKLSVKRVVSQKPIITQHTKNKEHKLL